MEKKKNLLVFTILSFIAIIATSGMAVSQDYVYGSDRLSPDFTINNNVTINKSGASSASGFEHNNLSGLDGGASGDFFHLGQSDYNDVTSDASDWITESEGDTRYILDSDESLLDVNSSEYWDGLQNTSQIKGSNIVNDLNWTNNTQSFWPITNNYLYNNTGTLTFNQSKLTTDYFNASSYNLNAGTLNGGSLENVSHKDGNLDGVTMNFSEVNSAPGFDLRYNFTNISDFNNIIFRYKTSTLSAPYPSFQLYDYDSNSWESYNDLVVSEDFRTVKLPVYNDDNNVENGTVRVRIEKPTKGKKNNDYFIDWVTISSGFATPTGEEVDPLSIHKDGDVPLEDNWDAGNYNITADNFLGTASESDTLDGEEGTYYEDLWNLSKDYLINQSSTLTLNETRLNNTVDNRNTNTQLDDEPANSNVNMSSNNVTEVNCIEFDNNSSWCSA